MKMVKWFLLLNKRLYKKITFVLIMLLIPTLVFGYSSLAQEESGVMTIALAQQGDDPMAKQIMQDLKDGTNLIRYVFCDSPESAEKMVNDGKAEAAWIFADDLENRIYRFVNRPSRTTAFVQIIEQESTIPMKLSREKISGTVFGYCSRTFYLKYIRENVPEMQDISDEALLAYYDDFATNVDLFEFSYLEGEGGAEAAEEANYLLSPVRGLLATVIILGGLAAAMYFVHDDRCGTFSLVPQGKRPLVEFTCLSIAVLNLSAIALTSLMIMGVSVSVGRELLLAACYGIMATLFCMTMRRVLGSITAIGTAMPLLAVVMLVVSPVFFDLGPLRTLQYLCPPTYYINAVNSNRYLLLMFGYDAILVIAYYLTGKLFKRK